MRSIRRAGEAVSWLFFVVCALSVFGQTPAPRPPVLLTVVDENGVAISDAQVVLQELGHNEIRFSTNYAGHGAFVLQGTESLPNSH